MNRMLNRAGLLSLVTAGVLAVGCNDIISFSHVSRERGLKLYDEADYDGAQAAFFDATRQNPRDYVSFYMLGQSYEKQGLEQKAIWAYKQSLAAQEVTADGRADVAARDRTINALSTFLATAQSRDLELAALERDAQEKNRARDWIVLAKTYAAMGDADLAIDAYNRARLQSPEDFELAKTYGLYLEGMAQKDRAQPHLIAAYRLNPADAEVIKALRRVGVVPGPSLLEANDLARPIVPKGPIPEPNLDLFPQDRATTPAGQQASSR